MSETNLYHDLDAAPSYTDDVRTVTTGCDQGELKIVRRDLYEADPSNPPLEPAKDTLSAYPRERKDRIAGHSETGHHHVVVGNASLTELDPVTALLSVDDLAELRHLKLGKYVHATARFKGPSEWVIKKQRQKIGKIWSRASD